MLGWADCLSWVDDAGETLVAGLGVALALGDEGALSAGRFGS